MDIDEDAEEMDIDSPPLPSMPTSPPCPSPPSSPTADPASSPPERTLTPAQLVASLHLRQREKNEGLNSKTGLKAKWWSSELGRTEGDGEIAAFTIGFGGVIAGMNRLGDIAKRLGGRGRGKE